MVKKKIVFLFGILILFSLTIISSVPPPQQNVNIDVGLTIEITQGTNFKNGEFHLFNAHVFNISTGLRVDNTTTDCIYHLFDNVGEHQINQVLMEYHPDGLDWDYNVTGENFTRNGDYSYLIVCNTTNIGGFRAINFEVTPNGEEFNIEKAISYIGFLIVLLFTFFLTIYGASQVRWEHLKSDEGKILTINHFRYVKVFLFAIAYFELMFLFGLSYKFFNEANIEGFIQFFNFIYQLFLRLIIPLMIFLIIIVFVIWINNKKLQDKIKLGT